MLGGWLKKRRLIFLGLLTLALLGVYLQPVFFPQKTQTIRPHESQSLSNGGNTMLKIEPIKATGFATWIGKAVTAFEKEYGQAAVVYDSGFGFEIHRYATTEENSYLEINSRNGKIAAIKTTGIDGTLIAPFKLKMTMGDLAQITMLYPNFTLKEENETTEIELMEEDLSYRPLVKFDNGTYSILFLNNLPELIGVMYLSQEMLLELAPYNIVKGETPHLKETGINWEQANHQKELQAFELLNVLRQQDNLKNYETTYTLQGQSRDFLTRFLKKPTDYLSDNRSESFKRVTQDDDNNEIFMITGSEFTSLAEKVEVPGINGFFETPCYDPTFQILSWYSDPYMHDRFLKEQTQAMAIGISQKNMVILFEDIKPTEDSE